MTRTDRLCEAYRNTLQEKLFWLPYVPLREMTQIVDIGCADGALLQALHHLHPTAHYVGVDRDPEMLRRCAKNLGMAVQRVEPAPVAKSTLGTSCVILSSVLHENPVDFFRREVEPLGHDYVVIRDFALPRRPVAHPPIPSSILEAIMRLHLCEDDLRVEASERYFRWPYDELLCRVTSGPYEDIHANHRHIQKFVQENAWRSGLFSQSMLERLDSVRTHAEIVLRLRRLPR